jgi:hypothetical protein
MSTYEVTREHFDRLVKRYHEYVKLYRTLNNGSIEGITSFESFYWRFTYLVKYQDTLRGVNLNG